MSSGRPNSVITHKKFPKDIIDWVVATPVEQAPAYREVFGDKVLPIAEGTPCFVGPHRQWVMEHFGNTAEYKYVWMMDDDLVYLKRTPELKLVKCKKKHMEDMFSLMREHMEDVHVAGVSSRLGNNRVIENYQEVGRMMNSYMFNVDTYIKEGINFAPYPDIIGEDFHVTLEYLNKGYPNRIDFTYAQTDASKNSEGGCSAFRTNDTQRKAAFWMAEHHPEVTVKTKSSGNWKIDGKGASNKRVDMTIQWKKGYKPKKVRKSGGLSALFNKNK